MLLRVSSVSSIFGLVTLALSTLLVLTSVATAEEVSRDGKVVVCRIGLLDCTLYL